MGVGGGGRECSLTLSQGQSQNHNFWFPHTILSDNSTANHSEISRIKPTQAEFPQIMPSPW